jgi:hypothetical protein
MPPDRAPVATGASRPATMPVGVALARLRMDG